MRVLLTGGTGFVGRHLSNALRQLPSVEVVATSKVDHLVSSPDESILPLDITDREHVRSVIEQCHPTHIVNLAAMAAASSAEADPQSAWKVHVAGTLNVAHAVQEVCPNSCLIHVSSGLVYGAGDGSDKTLSEESILFPIDDYAVTKAAADLALGALARRGLRVLRMRPFNHTGPGQNEAFVVANFAAQIAKIEAGLADPIIRVGNLETERDFLDVRDVVRAYCLAIARSDQVPSGAIFNIASGVPRKIRSILDALINLSGCPITVEVDAARMRSADLPRIVGDASRARRDLAWSPTFSFEQTLRDILVSFRGDLVGSVSP